MNSAKLSKQNVVQRIQTADQSPLVVIEPVHIGNLSKLSAEVLKHLRGGANTLTTATVILILKELE